MIVVAHSSGTIIQPLVSDDRVALYAAIRESIHTVGRWMSWCHPDYSMREVDAWITSCEENWRLDGTDREFGIFHGNDGEVLGCVGINQFNQFNHFHAFANLGYWVRASRTGCGIASTAARLAAQFAFHQLKLSRIEIVARVDNIASRRVAEKIGAQFECIARHRLLYKGHPHDAALYSLLPDDIGG